MTSLSLEDVRGMLEAPSAAVLTTYRQDASPLTRPVWFRWTGAGFQVVIARGDGKLRHLERDPRCALLIFETVAPFSGVEIRGTATLTACDVTEIRRSIAVRYLGEERGAQFTDTRASTSGVLLELVPNQPHVWTLAGILPS